MVVAEEEALVVSAQTLPPLVVVPRVVVEALVAVLHLFVDSHLRAHPAIP